MLQCCRLLRCQCCRFPSQSLLTPNHSAVPLAARGMRPSHPQGPPQRCHGPHLALNMGIWGRAAQLGTEQGTLQPWLWVWGLLQGGLLVPGCPRRGAPFGTVADTTPGRYPNPKFPHGMIPRAEPHKTP